MLEVGLQCFLELTLDEALMFIEKRVEMYNRHLEALVQSSAKVKAHIKLTLYMIDQLKETNVLE